MGWTFRDKRRGYDNIANGSAAGQERHIVGGGGIETTRNGIDNVGTSTDYTNSSNIAGTFRELVMGAQLVSDGNSIWFGARTAGLPYDPSSATTPGYTSTTSWTTAVGELPG